MEGPTIEAAARLNAAGGSRGSKETMVTPAQPSYGFQETHTTLCNYNGWFSAVTLDHTAPLVTEFRMTAPLDMFTATLATVAASTAWTKALNNVPFNGLAARGANPAIFPVTTATGANASEKANWFAFWAKMYEYYTVTACDYEIIISNPGSGTLNDVLVGMDFNSYSDTAGATGNKTPQASPLTDMMGFKHIRWMKLDGFNSADNKNNTQVIKGRYTPGMAARNISNDGDVKTWSLVAAQPTLKEFLTLYFYKHPLNLAEIVASAPPAGVNVQYNLKYTVQFKDLRVDNRYPTTGTRS